MRSLKRKFETIFFQIRNEIFQQVSLMPIDNVDDVDRLTGSLSSVFHNPLEISPESQESAANMIGSFMNIVNQLDSVDDAVNSLSNILDVSSKLLQSSSAMVNINDPNNTDAKAIKSIPSNDTKVSILLCSAFSLLVRDTLSLFAPVLFLFYIRLIVVYVSKFPVTVIILL